MVKSTFIKRILKRFEDYLISQPEYELGNNYSLILLIASDSWEVNPKWSIIISAKLLDKKNELIIISELLKSFNENLSKSDNESISRINIANSNGPFVKNFNFVFHPNYIKDLLEISNQRIGEIELEHAFALKSRFLENLSFNRATVIRDKNGKSFNAGILKLDSKRNLVYYTGKGLREIFKPDMNEAERKKAAELKKMSEDFLLKNDYLNKIPLKEIDTVGGDPLLVSRQSSNWFM